MGKREQLHLRREQRRQLFEIQRPVIAHRHKAQPRARSFRQQLPRHEIAVVLHLREQNHVAFANKFSAPCLGDEVDALGRPAREDDFVRARRADVFCDTPPRVFVSFRRARAQLVQAAMNIGIVMLVISAEAPRSPRAASARWPRYRNRSADGRAPARAESGNLREEPSNRQCCQQPCAHHNLLRAPLRATSIRGS